jgi:ubiquinone/menaquinone biosynthesis C-methylase UbiE
MNNAQFDRALLFFLLHEQPEDIRKKTLAEALRVIRPGGTLTIVDYARPSRLNPLRYLWCPIVEILEPFAGDLFRYPINKWLPDGVSMVTLNEQRFFGGLYQILTLQVI